ncbi:MAG: biosynthetic-type acetolactate synthase large subunit [Mycoplasmatales bacterium]
MQKITGARLVLEALKQLEISTIFGYPGGAVIPIYNELYDFAGIKHVFVRHEQGAAHAADGYARISGKLGVCLATSGPGATNLVTGIMTAHMDSVPMLAITGQVSSDLLGKDAFQETDIIGITLPITKHSFLIKTIEEIPKILFEACRIALTGRKGPVVVDIPRDIQLQTIDYTFASTQLQKLTAEYLVEDELTGYKLIIDPQKAVDYTNGNFVELKQLLTTSKRPIIIAGSATNNPQTAKLLTELTTIYQIPVVNTLLGLGCLPIDDSKCLGMIGMHGSGYANYALDQADLVIALGIRFDDRITGNPQTFIQNASIIHIEIDHAELNKIMNVDIGIHADINNGIKELLKAVEPDDFIEWNKQVQTLVKTYPMSPNLIHGQLTCGQVVSKISEITNGESIILTDVGQHQMWVAQHYKFQKPRHICTSGGAGTMGYGIPAAIGAKLAKPHEKVISFVGDGGFQMTNQELMTIKQEQIPVKIILINNRFLGMVRQWQELFNDNRLSFVDLSINPDFELLTKAYGLEYLKISSAADFKQLTNALNDQKPYVVEVIVAKEENVYPMIPSGRSINELILTGGSNE